LPTVGSRQLSAQDASFADRAFNDSFCENLPLGRHETVSQQCALI
jgi:hypothetical protein